MKPPPPLPPGYFRVMHALHGLPPDRWACVDEICADIRRAVNRLYRHGYVARAQHRGRRFVRLTKEGRFGCDVFDYPFD